MAGKRAVDSDGNEPFYERRIGSHWVGIANLVRAQIRKGDGMDMVTSIKIKLSGDLPLVTITRVHEGKREVAFRSCADAAEVGRVVISQLNSEDGWREDRAPALWREPQPPSTGGVDVVG